MIDVSHQSLSFGRLRSARAPFSNLSFGPLAVVVDIVTIIGLSVLSGVLYHLAVYDEYGTLRNYVDAGAIVALAFAAPHVLKKKYAISEYASTKGHGRRAFLAWNAAFLALFAIGFLTKSSDVFSRGSIIVFYVLGLVGVFAAHHLLVGLVAVGTRTGVLAARRIMLVGAEPDLRRFDARYQPFRLGLQVVAMVMLRNDPATETPEDFEADVEAVVEKTRMYEPEDVFLLLPWSDATVIDRFLQAFSTVPVSVHLGPGPIFERFADLRVSTVGHLTSLYIMRPPLNALERVVKRLFDIAASVLGLILMAPLFAAVAVAIKLDSKGPVFFVQRRLGFNRKPFRIVKFRTMTTLDDGETVRQVSRDDDRVTRVGRWLRRTNIDELPQLFNVLAGHMSVVGPRPHALAHDRAFEEVVARYARRSNVKPGITGWAQANGFRGETDTEDKIRSRVEHDLYYIDNWSIWFDIFIIGMTLTSPRAFSNAY